MEFLEEGKELSVLGDLTPQLLGGVPLLLLHRQAAVRTPEPCHLQGRTLRNDSTPESMLKNAYNDMRENTIEERFNTKVHIQ